MRLIHKRLLVSQVSLLTLVFLCEPFVLLSWHLYTLPLSPFEIWGKYKLEGVIFFFFFFLLRKLSSLAGVYMWPPKCQAKLLKPCFAVHKACKAWLVLFPTSLIWASWIKAPRSQPAPLPRASKLTGMNRHKRKTERMQTNFSTNLSALQLPLPAVSHHHPAVPINQSLTNQRRSWRELLNLLPGAFTLAAICSRITLPAQLAAYLHAGFSVGVKQPAIFKSFHCS